MNDPAVIAWLESPEGEQWSRMNQGKSNRTSELAILKGPGESWLPVWTTFAPWGYVYSFFKRDSVA
jgi:hypothetical protein